MHHSLRRMRRLLSTAVWSNARPISTPPSFTTTSSPFYQKWLKDYPFACQLAVATCKTSAADILVQTQIEKRSEIDVRRNVIFLLFGLTYLGGFQWWLLITKYKQWFPSMKRFGNATFAKKMSDGRGLWDAAKMVAFDVFVHGPIIYFPTYYTVKESVASHHWNPLRWVSTGLTKYYHNIKEDFVAASLVTIPSDCVQVVMPVHIRMLFRHFVSFFWTAYVSFSRGSLDDIVGNDEERNGAASGEEGTHSV